jgi:hypothetical protein
MFSDSCQSVNAKRDKTPSEGYNTPVNMNSFLLTEYNEESKDNMPCCNKILIVDDNPFNV